MKLALMRIGIGALLLAAITGCDRTESDWKQAKNSNTVPAYTDFISKHPQSSHVDEAKIAIDDVDWSEARAAGTLQAIDTYLKAHGSGNHATEANTLREVIVEDGAWADAKSANSLAAVQAYLTHYPTGRHAADANAAAESLAWNALTTTATVAELKKFLQQYPNGSHSADAKAKLDALLVRTFVPPESSGKVDEFLSALHGAGDEYKDYTMATAHSSIEVRKISISILNDLKTFDVPNGDMTIPPSGSGTLGPDEHEQITKTVLDACTKHIEDKCIVSETARYRIVIMIYGGVGIYFDSNQNPFGAMSVRLLLLDTSAKSVLWYTDKAWGPGKTAAAGATNAGVNIDRQLDTLCGDDTLNK